MYMDNSPAAYRRAGHYVGSAWKQAYVDLAPPPTSVRYPAAARLAILVCGSAGSWGLVFALIDVFR